MRFGRLGMVVMGLSIALAACAADPVWEARPPVPQRPTQVIGGLPVATMREDLPDLTDAEVANLVERAERAMEGRRVRRLVYSRTHPIGTRYLALQFECYDTQARIRRFHSVGIYWDEREHGGPGGWHARYGWDPSQYAEVCAPGRSFLDEAAVPETDIVKVYVTGDPTDDEIIDVVDAVHDDVPDGEKLSWVRRKDNGEFEVRTTKVSRDRSHSGSVLKVQRVSGGWTVARTGRWIS